MFHFKSLSAMAIIAAAAISSVTAQPVYTVGARQDVIREKAGGLSMFPEAPISILKSGANLEVLIPSGLRTAICKGPSMDKLVPTGWALSPSGVKGTYDVVSTHITSTWIDPTSKDIMAVFNANDSDNVPRIPGPGIGYRGRYFTAGLARSNNGGASFTKVGPILSIPKNATADPLQGDAFASVVMSPDNQYLYLYYGDMYSAMRNGGVQTCVARATVASQGLPGSWKKFYNGEWKTPGISPIDTLSYEGGEATPVVFNTVALYGDAMYPQVSYSKALGAYVMVYAVNVFDEIPPADSLGKFPPVELSGIYIAYSKDAITWAGHQQLVKAISIDYPGREVALHPTLVIDEAATTASSLKGTVYYGYNNNMWLGTPSTQWMASQTVNVTGITPDIYVSGIIAPKTARNAGFSILPGASGQYLVNFAKGDVQGVRIIAADGSEAGKALRVGEGSYRLQVTRSAGPLYLQGKRDGGNFSSYLHLP